MFDMPGPAHEPGRQLHCTLSLTVQENSVQQAHSWVASCLAGLGIHTAEQVRLVAALVQQLSSMLASNNPGRPRILTLRLFSAGVRNPSTHRWGFFIVNKPLRADRGVLEITIYSDPPV
jgi:hypothetical protein